MPLVVMWSWGSNDQRIVRGTPVVGVLVRVDFLIRLAIHHPRVVESSAEVEGFAAVGEYDFDPVPRHKGPVEDLKAVSVSPAGPVDTHSLISFESISKYACAERVWMT